MATIDLILRRDISDKDALTVEGVGHQGGFDNESVSYTGLLLGRVLNRQKSTLAGGYILSRWLHTFSPRASTEFLGYCDWTDRASYGAEARTTCSAELQQNLKISRRHSLIWGGGILGTYGAPYGSFSMRNIPGPLHNVVVSVFAQYDFVVIPDRVRLIAGSKFEHNTFTGLDVQPQIRGVWNVRKGHTLWPRVSRAVRTPTQIEETQLFPLTQLPGALPTFLTVSGNRSLKSEALRAYELGYRLEPIPAFSLDAALFYNHYSNLINVNLVSPLQAAGSPILHTNPLFAEIPVPWEISAQARHMALRSTSSFGRSNDACWRPASPNCGATPSISMTR